MILFLWSAMVEALADEYARLIWKLGKEAPSFIEFKRQRDEDNAEL